MANLLNCIKEYTEESALIGGGFLITIIVSILEKKWSIFFMGVGLTSLIFIGILPLISYIIRLKYIAIIYRFLFQYVFILVASFIILLTLSVNKDPFIIFETVLLLLYIYLSLKYLNNLVLFDDFEFNDYIDCRKYFKTTTAKTTTYSPPSPKPKHSTTTKKTSPKSSSTIVCINCGKKVKNHKSSICPYCGKDISKKINFKKCSTCASEYDASSSHCPYCGAENK